MTATRKPQHVSNFLSNKLNFVAIVRVEFNAKTGETLSTPFASGKTVAEAVERFFSRLVVRACPLEMEMMVKAQRTGKLRIIERKNNEVKLVDAAPVLIA